MSKKKAPALHERRGREDISTRPPRLAGSPIKLAGDARLRRLSLAADSCVNRKYYGGDPGVGQRKTGLHTIPPSGRAAEGRAQGFRRFRTSRKALNVLSERAQDLTERKTYPPRPARSDELRYRAAKMASMSVSTPPSLLLGMRHLACAFICSSALSTIKLWPTRSSMGMSL